MSNWNDYISSNASREYRVQAYERYLFLCLVVVVTPYSLIKYILLLCYSIALQTLSFPIKLYYIFDVSSKILKLYLL